MKLLYNYFKTAVLGMALFMMGNAQAQVPNYVPTDGLVGYWPFNGNANDTSGNNNNGTVNGATLTTDRNGNANSAYSFDGINDFISTNTQSLQFPNGITISCWAKLNASTSTHQFFVSKGYDSNDGAIFLGYRNFYSTENEYFAKSGIFSSNSEVYSGTPLNFPSNWDHVVFTYDNQTLSIFVNGTLKSSKKYVSKLATLNKPFLFGSETNPSFTSQMYYTNGKIDDIAIYNRALTQQEITSLYTEVPYYSDTCNAVSGSLTQGLVGYWPFCGNANDDSGHGNNGTVNGATLTTDRFGNANSAFSFNGTSNYINLNTSLPNTFSISLWINVNQFKSFAYADTFIGSKIIGTIENTNPYTGFECGLDGVQANYGKHGCSFWVQNNTNPNVASSNLVKLNNWKHLICTYNGTTLKYYDNGQLVGSVNGVYNNNQKKLTLGARLVYNGGPYFFFDGKIDDIGIWNRALTETEITNLYNANQCFTNITVTDTLIINVGQLSYTNPVTYANAITIAPNPASTQVNINFSNITDLNGGTIKIINSLGQQVATTRITATGTNTTMTLNTWGGHGMYFVQIVNPQGQIVDIKKIILQ